MSIVSGVVSGDGGGVIIGDGGLVGVIGGDCCGVALAVGVGVTVGGLTVGVAVGGLQAASKTIKMMSHLIFSIPRLFLY